MEKLIQIDNFVIYEGDDSELKYFLIKSVACSWELKFYEQNAQYNIIKSLLGDEDGIKALEFVINFWFLTTNCTLDIELMDDVSDAILAQTERQMEKLGNKQLTEEEEEEDLFVDKTLESLKEE